MVLPMEKTCRACGQGFWVGCLDGKRKNCWKCTAEKEHAEVLVLLDKVESLEAEVDRLREALKRLAETHHGLSEEEHRFHASFTDCPVLECRRARAALRGEEA